MDPTRLQSGRDVLIRSIRADDGARLQEAYGRLSPESRYQRFLVSKPRLTSADARYLVEVDGLDHVALVAFDVRDPEWIIGVARSVRRRDDPRAAELAVVVGDPFQREGLGTELVQRLATAARDRGIDRLTATMLAQNRAAHRLLGRLSNHPIRALQLGGVHELEVDLAPADGSYAVPAAVAVGDAVAIPDGVAMPGTAAMIGGCPGR